MPSKRVTKRSVGALRCPSGKDRYFLWDDALSGFGVVAFPRRKDGDSGKERKVYIIQYRQKGRSRRMKIGEHGRLTPDQARSEAKKLLAAVERGGDPIAQRRADRAAKTFGELAEEHHTLEVLPKRKPRTAEEYRRLLDLHILPNLGSKIAPDLRRADVARLHGKMKETPAAANRAMALISTIWNWSAGRDEVPEHTNPTRGIERYPEQPKERYLSMEELGRLGDALRKAETEGLPWAVDEKKATAKHIPKKNRLTKLDPYAVAALRLLILTGARLREILGAKWEFVDWDRGLLHLPDSKTGKKTIYLPAPALLVLEGLSKSTGPYIIPGLSGGRKKKASKAKKADYKPRADLKKPWAAVSRAAGLENVRLHDLRHSLGLPVTRFFLCLRRRSLPGLD